MRIICNGCTDPFFNLAAEEYLCDRTDGDVFMLWRNDRSVIIGKNQNVWAEVNVPFARESSVSVVRRLTGGGAVFHDLGNVNFTFITDGGADGIDFARFAAPVIRYLVRLGVKAELGGRNDILADGKKISGNAQCVRTRPDGSKRLMHHGTLLYSADISEMTRSLTVNREKLVSKGIDSVKSRVGNIRDMIPSLGNASPEDFMNRLLAFAEEEYSVAQTPLSCDETESVSRLANEKYRTWEWNFGASPAFSDEKSLRFPYGRITAAFDGEHGVFSGLKISGDFFGTVDVSELENALVGCPIEPCAVAQRLESFGRVGECISGCEINDLLELFFVNQGEES